MCRKLYDSFLGVMTGVYATYKQGTVPVYRYYNNFDHDHVYTSNYHKWGKGGSYRTPDGEHGYTYEVGLRLCLFLCVVCV